MNVGSGKSSQVPQYIIDTPELKAKLVVVACPRRIAATSLAKRVAQERNCEIGEEVSFAIGDDSNIGKNTRIVFVTCGWLLVKLANDPVFIDKCTHIILDEVHERSVGKF